MARFDAKSPGADKKKVLMHGVEQSNVIACDPDTGWYECAVLDPNGRPRRNDNGRLMTVEGYVPGGVLQLVER